jgi:alkanesulfonate monooxygenase SsuD/methylene tetrahydromethanopterin reductase-like flavin-dependent oxidoreductase (luciferase family)
MQMVELYDRAGFYCYHVAEHHHSPLCLAANQAVYLAAVAQRTTNLRLATAVSVLPLHNPVRLVEELCMLDQLSGGRVEIGVGRGTDRAQELRMWGGDAAENDERFEESLAVLLEGLRCEFLTHSGRFFNYKDLWMALRPAQLPRPPLWWPGSAEHAGLRGMNFIAAERADIAATRGVIEKYLEAYSKSATPELAGRPEPLYGATKRLYLAETEDEALQRARSSWSAFRSHFLKPLPGGGHDPNEVPRPYHLDFDTALASQAVMAGTPAMVCDYLQQYASESGANYFVACLQWGDLTHEEAKRSVELFASEVMPAVAEVGA